MQMFQMIVPKLKVVVASLLFVCTLLAIQAAAQGVPAFPNEMAGYQLHGRGKLESLRLGISTQRDVEGVFGSACSAAAVPCSLDDDWNVKFEYLAEWELFTTTPSARPEFAGRVIRIELRPTKRLPFGNLRFPKTFKRKSEKWSEVGSHHPENALLYDLHIYTHDVLGLRLEYRLYNGDLDSIVYSIPDYRLAYILQKRMVRNK